MLWVGLIAQAHAQGLANASKVRSAVAPPDRLGNKHHLGGIPGHMPPQAGRTFRAPPRGALFF
jgi:hypothetical protein